MDVVELVRPPKLRRGDKVIALTLSWGGPAAIPHRFEAGKRQLASSLELEVVESRNTRADATWLERPSI